MLDFVALDFETANKYANSACSLALVRVKNGEIVDRAYELIKPPFSTFDPECIEIHGIHPKDVADAPKFPDLWDRVFRPLVENQLVIAHNARFDMGVLRATLDYYKIPWPDFQFGCTVKMSRKVWPDLANHKLNTMGAFLGVPFRHHYALDDAETCAKVAIAAANQMKAQSLPELMDRIQVNLDPFLTKEKREEQSQAEVGEQMSFF